MTTKFFGLGDWQFSRDLAPCHRQKKRKTPKKGRQQKKKDRGIAKTEKKTEGKRIWKEANT